MKRLWGEPIFTQKNDEWQEIVIHATTGDCRARFRYIHWSILELWGCESHGFSTEIEAWLFGYSRPDGEATTLTEMRGHATSEQVEKLLAKYESDMKSRYGV